MISWELIVLGRIELVNADCVYILLFYKELRKQRHVLSGFFVLATPYFPDTGFFWAKAVPMRFVCCTNTRAK